MRYGDASPPPTKRAIGGASATMDAVAGSDQLNEHIALVFLFSTSSVTYASLNGIGQYIANTGAAALKNTVKGPLFDAKLATDLWAWSEKLCVEAIQGRA
jgi:hypothetical protein